MTGARAGIGPGTGAGGLTASRVVPSVSGRHDDHSDYSALSRESQELAGVRGKANEKCSYDKA